MWNYKFSKLEMKAITISKKIVESYDVGRCNPELIISYKPAKGIDSKKAGRLKIQVYFNEKEKEPYIVGEVSLKNNELIHIHQNDDFHFSEKFLEDYKK